MAVTIVVQEERLKKPVEPAGAFRKQAKLSPNLLFGKSRWYRAPLKPQRSRTLTVSVFILKFFQANYLLRGLLIFQEII